MNKNCPDLLLSPVDDAIANAKDHVDPHVEEGQSQARPTEERHVNKIKQFLGHLITVEPEGVNVVCEGAWEEITMYVDSGATETVIGDNTRSPIELKEGAASRRGVQYEVANSVRIPNLGEKTFRAHTEEGAMRNITAQVCDVNKALLSVSRMVRAGHRVVFDEESYIEDRRTGEKLWLIQEGGMYALKVWVPSAGF